MKNIFIVTILLSLNAFAGPKTPLSKNTRDHLTIKSVEVVDLTEQYEAQSQLFENSKSADALLNTTPFGRALTIADVAVDKIINIGQKVWNVVEKGRPVQNYSRSTGNALPARALRWDQLQNWSAPKAKVVGVIYKNIYGFEVVRFTYRIILLSGGDVQGIGRYIGYATVEPLEMTTAYMYNFDAKVSVEAVYNMGSSANPVAGMLLKVDWTVSTVLKKSNETRSYTLDGNGNISAL